MLRKAGEVVESGEVDVADGSGRGVRDSEAVVDLEGVGVTPVSEAVEIVEDRRSEEMGVAFEELSEVNGQLAQLQAQTNQLELQIAELYEAVDDLTALLSDRIDGFGASLNWEHFENDE